jgi:hypothetical protein
MSRRPVVLAALVLATVVATALPSSASYEPARTVRGCAGSIKMAAVGGGTLWGATSCASQPVIQVVTGRPGGTWRHLTTPWSGRVLAVADDGSTTFVVWTDSRHHLQIGRRPHAGPASAPTQLSTQGDDVALVARAGRWWAVWSESGCTNHLEGCSATLWQAKSLGRGIRPERVLAKADQVGTHDGSAGLALRGDDAFLVFLRVDPDGYVIHYAKADLDGVWTDGLFAPSVAASSPFRAAITVAGERVIVGWVSNQLPMVSVQNGSGDFVTYPLPHRAQTADVQVAASGGRAFVGHTSCFQYRGGSTCRTYVSTLTADGTVTGTTELSAGTGDHTLWGLEDLVAAGGVATAAVSTASALVARSGF